MRLKAIAIIICIILTFAACVSAPSKQPLAESDFADKESSVGVDDGTSESKSEVELSETELTKLKQYVEIFAQSFDSPFRSTDDLDQNSIGWFAFWRIYEDQGIDTNSEGFCIISEADFKAYILTRFGIDNYEYTDLTPVYDSEKKEYQFYPLGEGSLNDVQVVDFQVSDNDTVECVVNITTNPMSDEQTVSAVSRTLKYRFKLESADDVYYLQAVEAL